VQYSTFQYEFDTHVTCPLFIGSKGFLISDPDGKRVNQIPPELQDFVLFFPTIPYSIHCIGGELTHRIKPRLSFSHLGLFSLLEVVRVKIEEWMSLGQPSCLFFKMA
jgi:hypothetical protein